MFLEPNKRDGTGSLRNIEIGLYHGRRVYSQECFNPNNIAGINRVLWNENIYFAYRMARNAFHYLLTTVLQQRHTREQYLDQQLDRLYSQEEQVLNPQAPEPQQLLDVLYLLRRQQRDLLR